MERILATEGIKTTCRTIQTPLPDGRKLTLLKNAPEMDPLRKYLKPTLESIDDAKTGNDELTAPALLDILTKNYGADNVQYGIRTIARLHNKLRRTVTIARYCQAICDANKLKRLDWCKNRIDKKEAFDDVIFTDESAFQL